MAYHIEIAHQAARALIRIQRGDRAGARRIDAAIEALRIEPRPSGAVKMSDGSGFRIRVGGYRVVYAVDDTIRVVKVTRVGPRGSVYER